MFFLTENPYLSIKTIKNIFFNDVGVFVPCTFLTYICRFACKSKLLEEIWLSSEIIKKNQKIMHYALSFGARLSLSSSLSYEESGIGEIA